MELEAEPVAYLVCQRRSITAKSQSYLANYVNAGTSLSDLDLYEMTKAAGIEDARGIAAHTLFAPQPRAPSASAGPRPNPHSEPGRVAPFGP